MINSIKNFLIKHKRLLFALSCCFMAVLIISIVAVKSTQTTSKKDETVVQTNTPTTISFIMPIENGTITKDYSSTSLKYNATLKQWEAHKAVDIKGEDGANVLAVYAGEVVSIENDYLRGTVVTIAHTSKLKTVYASLDENVSVKVGDKVKIGDVIGKVSTSAKSELKDGKHLHFEVLVDGVKADPNIYLPNSNK